MRQTKWFATPNEASAFIAGKSDADVWPSSGGWSVAWDEPEPPSAFERIVSRNGGEPSLDATYTGGKTIRDSFIDALKEPAEIVQRLKVRSVGMECDDSFYVCVCFPGQEHGSVFIPISQADTSRFKVGSIIEVVLRPAPLA